METAHSNLGFMGPCILWDLDQKEYFNIVYKRVMILQLKLEELMARHLSMKMNQI